MSFRVLVAFASKHGSTAEIAKKIGETLRTAGLDIDVMPVDRVTDVTPYAAVVLGSAIYEGRWQTEAEKFLDDFKSVLTKIPVWIFSSGPLSSDNSATLFQGWHIPSAQQAVADYIHARDIALFSGAIDVEKLTGAERQIVKEFKFVVGDHRDWSAINNWCVSIAASLRPEVAE